jgi:hypothetical protein
MTEQAVRIGTRYNELRAQGKSGTEAARIVNEEFHTDLAVGSISKYASLVKKQFVSPTEQGEHKERKGPSGSTKDAESTLASLDKRLTAVEKLLQVGRNEGNIITDTQDMPPEPQVIKGEGKGRRENRDYEKVSVTIDKVLWKKFCQERDRLRVSSGRLMDAILWREFGRPRLSYEPTDEN